MSAPDCRPCPFCGNDDPAIDEIDLGIWAVVCDVCRCIGPHSDREHSADKALAAWNVQTQWLEEVKA